jgi:prepilin-type N-terminal cleavage/methylation domain-containing protein
LIGGGLEGTTKDDREPIPLQEENTMFRRKREDQRGFTLIELLIVMALLGVLVAVLLPKYQDLTPEAKIAATQQNLETLRSAVLIYAARHPEVGIPSSLDTLVAEGLIRKMPTVKISGSITTTVTTELGMSCSNGGGWLYASDTGLVMVDINNIVTFIPSYTGSVNPYADW